MTLPLRPPISPQAASERGVASAASATPRYHRRAPGSGFTLVELLVAAVLVGLVVASATALSFQVTGAKERLARSTAHHAEADAAMRAITTALRHTFRNPAPEAVPPILFIGTDDEIDGRPADRLRFMRVSDRAVRPQTPESDVHEVEFWLEEVEDARYPALVRRTDPTRNEPPDLGGVVERVAENIVALDLTYFDGEAWTDDWPDFLEARPIAVRVRLSVALDPEAADTSLAAARPYTSLIYLPWMPQPATEASGGDATSPGPGTDANDAGFAPSATPPTGGGTGGGR